MNLLFRMILFFIVTLTPLVFVGYFWEWCFDRPYTIYIAIGWIFAVQILITIFNVEVSNYLDKKFNS